MKSSSGIIKEPFFILLYGVPGVGKSTFLAEAPKPKVIDVEGSSRKLNVDRFQDIESFDEVIEAIKQLRDDKHSYESAGIDSLDALEPLVFKKVCEQYKVKSIEDVGYGKGYVAALDYWQQCINALKDLRANRNMNIICIAHNHVKTTADPMQILPYDRHLIKLNEKAGAKWKESVDALLFGAFEDTVFKVNSGDRKAKATDSDGGNRKLFTVRRAAFDAKNRLGLPPVLPLSWSAFAEAAEVGQPDSLEQVMADLTDLALQLSKKDKGMADRMHSAITAAEGNLAKLVGIRNHGRIVLET